MIFSHRTWRRALALLCSVSLLTSSANAARLNFTVNMNKTVQVTGTPRFPIDIGGVPKYAEYSSGDGSSVLTFSYDVQARDFDADGISVTPTLDLNGGTIIDTAGNPITNMTFTAPNTSGVKVQTYTVAFTTGTITSANVSTMGFQIFKAPQNASFNYSIVSDGPSSPTISNSGTILSNAHLVSPIDLSSLPPGRLTLTVTVSVSGQGTGAARTAQADLDQVAPTGYSIAFVPSYVNDANKTTAAVQLSGAEVGATYSYTVTSDAVTPGSPVTGSGTVTAASQQITLNSLAGLGDGLLTIAWKLTDTNGNAGSDVTATITKDTVAPTIVSVMPPADDVYNDL